MSRYTSTKTGTNAWNYDVGVKDNYAELKKLQAIAKKNKLEIPKGKAKASLLDRLFGFLNAGETAPGVYEYLGSKDVGKAAQAQGQASLQGLAMQGMGAKKTYEDVLVDRLGYKKDIGTKVAGIAGDILLDPTTYFGGAIAKVGIKGLKKVGGKAVKVASKVPVLGPMVEGGAKGLDELAGLFSPVRRAMKGGVPKETAQAYIDLRNKLIKEGRYSEAQIGEALQKIVKGTVKEGGADVGTKIGQAIETGTTLEGKTGKTQEFIQQSFKDMLETEQKAGIEIGNRANYLTHTLTDEARQFTKRYGYDIPALQKGLGSANVRTIEGTIPDINKEFRTWLTSKGEKPFDLFEQDAFKAFGARSKASVKALNAKKIKDTIADTFGIPEGDIQAKAGAGFFSEKTNIIDGVKYVPMPGLRIPKELGEGFKDLTSKGKVWVPEGIAKDLDEINKVFINDDATNSIMKLWDNVLGWWKGSVTGMFPSFHANNLKGGMFNNWLAGVNNPARYLETQKLLSNSTDILKTKGFTGTYKELMDELGRRGAVNAGGYLDVFSKVDEATQVAVGKIPTKGLVKKGTAAVMNKIETINRGSLALDTLRKGGTMDEAVKKIFKYQFDYAPEAFTPFERNFMKRVIPFYTWSRNNIPLMIEAAVKQPGKVGAVGKIARDVSNITPEERAQMPDYMRESFPVKIGDQAFYGANLPIEDINRLNMKGVLSSIAPMIKYPLEKYTGKNFFFDQPIESFKSAPSWFKAMPKPIKDYFGYEEKKSAKGKDASTLDPYKYHLLTSVLGRYVFTADKLADPETSATIKTLYSLLGVKGTNFNPQQLEYYNTKDDIEKLKNFLIKKGAVKEFKTTYEPKK
jgi:hypothetical protein